MDEADPPYDIDECVTWRDPLSAAADQILRAEGGDGQGAAKPSGTNATTTPAVITTAATSEGGGSGGGRWVGGMGGPSPVSGEGRGVKLESQTPPRVLYGSAKLADVYGHTDDYDMSQKSPDLLSQAARKRHKVTNSHTSTPSHHGVGGVGARGSDSVVDVSSPNLSTMSNKTFPPPPARPTYQNHTSPYAAGHTPQHINPPIMGRSEAYDGGNGRGVLAPMALYTHHSRPSPGTSAGSVVVANKTLPLASQVVHSGGSCGRDGGMDVLGRKRAAVFDSPEGVAGSPEGDGEYRSSYQHTQRMQYGVNRGNTSVGNSGGGSSSLDPSSVYGRRK